MSKENKTNRTSEQTDTARKDKSGPVSMDLDQVSAGSGSAADGFLGPNGAGKTN